MPHSALPAPPPPLLPKAHSSATAEDGVLADEGM
jgi:hypothetical protein